MAGSWPTVDTLSKAMNRIPKKRVCKTLSQDLYSLEVESLSEIESFMSDSSKEISTYMSSSCPSTANNGWL
jgi:hypothetical protein